MVETGYFLQSSAPSGFAPLVSTMLAELYPASRVLIERLSGLSASQCSSLVFDAQTFVWGLPIVLQSAYSCTSQNTIRAEEG